MPTSVGNAFDDYLRDSTRYTSVSKGTSKSAGITSTMIGGASSPVATTSIPAPTSAPPSSSPTSNEDNAPPPTSDKPVEQPRPTSTEQDSSTTQDSSDSTETSSSSTPNHSDQDDEVTTGTDASTLLVHSTTLISSKPSIAAASTKSTKPTLSTPAIAGTAAGGTLSLALLIGTIYLCMRRRKRYQASSPDMWAPDHNASDKPLPDHKIQAAYAELGGAAATKPTHAELHSKSKPRVDTQAYLNSSPGEKRDSVGMRGGAGSTRERYYVRHPPSSLPSPTSPSCSELPSPSIPAPWRASSAELAGTAQGWRRSSSSPLSAELSNNYIPTSPVSELSAAERSGRMSRAELGSEGAVSPVVERVASPIRTQRSAELHFGAAAGPVGEVHVPQTGGEAPA